MNLMKNSAIYSLLQDEIGLKEWALSLRSTHKSTHDLIKKLKKPFGKMFIQEEADSLTSTTNTNGN